jgi:5-formyltetrahydrofolate cyclo-ligase
VTGAGPAAVQRWRERIWHDLREVGRPDSRFHWDFSSFIPDFTGSDACADTLAALPAWQDAGLLFITPDNSTEHVRRRAIRDGKPFLFTTYGIRRGFFHLDPSSVPAGAVEYAATLDGIESFAEPRTMAGIEAGDRVGLLVTGGSAVARNGVRFGKGHGYFDLEWALLSSAGAVDSSSLIVDVVHDCQVIDEDLTGAGHDVPVDAIVTPTRVVWVDVPGRKPGWIRWDLLAGSPLATIPPVVELKHRT